MKAPENKSYRIQSSKNNKINIENNLNSTKNPNLNKIKVNFLNNLKQKKNLQHNNSSIYAIPKKITKQQKKQTNINISNNDSFSTSKFNNQSNNQSIFSQPYKKNSHGYCNINNRSPEKKQIIDDNFNQLNKRKELKIQII